MNSTCYRIVFNKHRGQLMAVAETASSCTKGATGESSPIQTSTRTASAQPNFTFRALSLCLWGAFVFGGNAVAQVVADPSAPANQRPTILKDAQGRPLVNIQTPSAAGLSRNTYTQFDVPTGGVVLNNSTSNPWMSNGVFAKTILNEVNSTSASQIKGAVTLNGAAAQVIFANPNGINVDGGSFINATRVTLATGKANVSNGAVTGFNITGGQITVGAGGLNNSKTPYTDLISRTLALTGKLQAADLSVTTGLQTVDYATGLISNQNTTPNTSGTFAIDTAALGGMYANNISLLSTEAGLGVRNQGTWQASAGQLVVTADGQLRNVGTIQAKVASLATVSGDITNSGKLLGDQALVVSAGGNLNVQGTGLVQNTGSTLILNANKNINVQKTTDYGVAKILSTEGGGQLSMSAGQAVVVDADSTVAAHRSVQISSDGTLSLNKASVIATEGEVSVMAAKDMTVTNSQVTGQNVHLETGVAFDDKTLGNIQITGGNIRGSTQTTVIASGNLKVTGNGGTPVSGAGNVYLNAEKTLEVSSNTTLDAKQHMSLTAGTDVVLYGNNTQHVTATAGGNLLVAGNGVELQASKLKAGNNLELQAYNGPLKQFAMKDTAGSTADRVTLNATNSLNVATYKGKTLFSGVQATAKDINIVGNGQTQLIGTALKQGSNSTWLGNQLTATDSLSIANLNDTAGVTSQLEINTTELKAAGLARVIGNGQLLLGSQVNTISGKNSPAAVSITAGSIGVQSKQVSTYASQLTTNGDKSTTSKNGNIDLIATDSTLLLNAYQGVNTQLNATGDIRLHAKGDMTATNLKAKGTGNLLGTSATGKITATGSQLEARDQLSLASQGAQSHTNGVYKGGVTSLYNKTGTMNLVNVQASGLGTTTASLSKLGAQVSVESGGSISMDAASALEGQTAVTFIQGQGDITLNPSSVAQGTVRWSQVDSNGTTSLVAKNGNINLTGIAGTTGAGTSSTVNISALGNLNLVGNNVNLQASSLFVDGVLNIDATKGNVIASALRETKDGNTMAWKGSYVRGAKGLNIHAAKTIGLDSFTGRSTAGSINLASDGVLNSQNSTVIASDLLSVNSAEAQSHNNTTLQGGATSVYNKTGAMTLINANIYGVGTSNTKFAVTTQPPYDF